MKPIPATADIRDPLWGGALADLAVELVREGCKARIVKRFTAVPHKRIAELYRTIHGLNAPGGPCYQGDAQFFVTGTGSNRFSGSAWNVQGTAFLTCYRKLAVAVGGQVNRGWLLLMAYRAYLALTTHLADSGARRLDINHAYALLVFAGFNTVPELSDITLKVCGRCCATYLIDTRREPEAQACPVCAIRQNMERLGQQSRRQSLRPLDSEVRRQSCS